MRELHLRSVVNFACSGWRCRTHAGHAGQVQGEAVEAVAGVALLHPHTAAVLTAVQDAALLGTQALEGLQSV